MQAAPTKVSEGQHVNDPVEPPPIVRMNTPLGDAQADQDAQDQHDWELREAREKTKQLRALFSNRAYVEPDGKHLRISFGERIGDEDIYHSAIVIPFEEAAQFGDLLLRMAQAGLSLMWDQIRAAVEEERAAAVRDETNG